MRARARAGMLAALALLATGCASGGRGADAEHVEAMAREHAHDAPAANASTMEPAQPVVTEEVVYGRVGGQPITGYLARPARGGDDLPGVVVIHEWWGLNDNVRMMTRRLAGEGYVALAVDMYGGQTASDPAAARALMQQAMQNRAAGVENLRAAATFLREQRDAEEVGILGWCFGGGWTLQGALQLPELLDAAVMYYGQPVTDRAQLARLDAPLLGLFGGKDEGIPVAQVREMERLLDELGKDATIVVYPDADHAFANPSGGNYLPEPAADAWRRATAFLAEHLK